MDQRAEPVLEGPVLGPEPVHLGPEFLQVALLPHPGTPCRLPVRDHPPAPSLLVQGRRPVRFVRAGVRAGPGRRPMDRGRLGFPGAEPQLSVEVLFEEREREVEGFFERKHGDGPDSDEEE